MNNTTPNLYKPSREGDLRKPTWGFERMRIGMVPEQGLGVDELAINKKDESRLCRLVFYWSPSFKIRSIRAIITTKTL